MADKEFVEIPVEGMTCGGCVKSVTNALLEEDGVDQVEVYLEMKKAVVRMDPDRSDRSKLVARIEDAGFEVPAEG